MLAIMFFSNISLANETEAHTSRIVQYSSSGTTASITRYVETVVDEKIVESDIPCALPIKTIEKLVYTQVNVDKDNVNKHYYSGDTKTNELSTTFININKIQHIKVDDSNPKQIIIALDNSNSDKYVVKYASQEDAINGIKKFFQTMDNCQRK